MQATPEQSTPSRSPRVYTTGKHTLDHSPELKDQRNASVLYVFGL
jgi:hypothetical protein